VIRVAFPKHAPSSFSMSQSSISRDYSTQTKDEKPESESSNEQQTDKQQQKEHPFELVYTSTYSSTVYGVKFLSFTGCLASLLVAPFIIFDPLHVPLLANISMLGKCFLGIPVAVFGVGTSFALHLFTKSIVTKMYHNKATDEMRLQFVTLYLKTVTLNTNLKNMKALDKKTQVGVSNVNCTDINKYCFINPEHLPEDIANRIGLNEEDESQSMDDDTSWMGKQ